MWDISMKRIFEYSLIILASSFILGAISACKPRLRLPEDSSLGGNAQWLIISSQYCQMKNDPTNSSQNLAILRKGTVLRIIESKYSTSESDRGTLWFRIQEAGQTGWVPALEVNTYSSENQARNAALRME